MPVRWSIGARGGGDVGHTPHMIHLRAAAPGWNGERGGRHLDWVVVLPEREIKAKTIDLNK